jgi:hypothetical protein
MPLATDRGTRLTEMKGALFLDVVVGQCPSILELLPSEDKSLLIRGDSKLTVRTPLGDR